MNNTNKKRIQILSDAEVIDIYTRPAFNHLEREEYFVLDTATLATINTMTKLETKVYLILLIGYFRAKPVVPMFQLQEVRDDVEHVCHTYFEGAWIESWSISKSTRQKLVSKMLSILDYERYTTQDHQDNLTARLQDVATICSDPRYIFDECLAYFGQNRIALAGYSTLQDLVTQTLTYERSRTESVLSKRMSDLTLQRLKNILKKQGILNSLSGYKGSARDFSPTEIDRELATHNTIKPLYPELKVLIEQLGLSQGNLNYYASVVKHRSLYKLRRFPQWQAMLYLVCYLYFRYRETNDKLVTIFCHLVAKQREYAKLYAKDKVSGDLDGMHDRIQSAGKILNYFIDDNISDSTPFGAIRHKALSLMPQDDIVLLGKYLETNSLDALEYEWQYIEDKARKTANSLRKSFTAMDIECEQDQLALDRQITNAKTELISNGIISTIDQRIILKKDKQYLRNQEGVSAKRFEFYLYHRTAKMIDAGKIYVAESEHNRRLDDDLISEQAWRNKRKIVHNTGLHKLINPINQTLKVLEDRLTYRIQQVTDAINADTNEFVKRQTNTNKLVWSLAHKKTKNNPENPIYSQIRHMGIIDIMDYVNEQTGYLSAFKTFPLRKHSIRANSDDLIACIFGNGSNYGLLRMAAVSDRSAGVLRTVNDGYIRPDTIHAANDIISNATAELPIFKYYTINETAPFGSIDGQKHGSRINTFKARHSAKFFRKGKGVSSLTLVANHIPTNANVIAPNEYEGHFAFDLLYGNSSEVRPVSLATDTHGVNNVNFAILDMFGYQFAPRYAKFKKVFQHHFKITFEGGLKIQLKKPINNLLIEQEWDQIQRIMCSLSRKTGTQKTIIKKLSSSKRKSRTLAALHEYDRLIKSIYLLDYADSKTLRQFVQQALNRGEAYHQLRRAIASINGNQFKGGDDYQIEQWNDCARLIANCIIYYNSVLLSTPVEHFKSQGKQDVVDMITNLSPVAWTHIQLAGHYNFGSSKELIDLESLLRGLTNAKAFNVEELVA
jgi:TnpA family transposase